MVHTVLGIKISHGHDHTSCATLGHFEMEFWCGACSYDTWAQCWVQSFIVGAAHFDVTVLKVRPTGEGGTMLPWCYHPKPYRPGQRLLGSVRGWTKCKRVREGDYSTSKQNTSTAVGNSRPHHLDTFDDGNLVCQAQDCLLLLLLMTIKTAKIGAAKIWTAFSRYSWTFKIWYPSSSERTQSRLPVAREHSPDYQ